MAPSDTTYRRWTALALFLAGVVMVALGADVGPTSDDYFHFLGIRQGSANWLFDATVPPERWGFFRPLGLWELYLYLQLGGFQPGWLRVGHALLHGTAAVLTGELAGRLGATGARRFVAGLLFSVHPGIVQAVGLLSCRFDLWATALCLMAVLAFDRSLEPGSRGALAASVAAFALALGFKECAVVLPAILLCWCLWRGREAFSFLGLVPHVFVATGYLLGRGLLLGWGGPYGAPHLVPTLPELGAGWAGALAAFTAWPGHGPAQLLLGAIVFLMFMVCVVRSARGRAGLVALGAGLIWLLPAVALLSRCADDIAGRLMYGAWPWFAIALVLVAPSGWGARRLRVATALGALLLMTLANSRLEACRRAGHLLRDLGNRAVEAAARSPVPVVIALDKTPGILDGTFLFPGGLGLVSSAMALLQGTRVPIVCEKGWPLDAQSLINQDHLMYLTLDHRDGFPGRPARLPEGLLRPSKPLQLRPLNASAVLESPDLEVATDQPVVLSFSARAILAPQTGRATPLAWGEVLTRRTRVRTYSPRERSLFVLVADGRWRTYQVVLDPGAPSPGFDHDRYFHKGVPREELKQLRGIRLVTADVPGRVWIRDAAL
jgi:hypothetical protein